MRAIATMLVATLLLAACSPGPAPPRPEAVRARIVRLLPAGTRDREGWAADVYAAFVALDLPPDTQNLCAALAVTEQESGFSADPAVPGLAKIARAEIDRRAASVGLPQFVLRRLLHANSPNGKRYDARLAAVRTEQDLSRIYDDFVDPVPLGRRLLAGANPVHTAGPMQVSIAFAEQFARAHRYPYARAGTIRQEVFSRRGGLYFGVAHLLAYPANYGNPLYRFADYNAGFYASRNAAFQQAVSTASGIPLALDGDLVPYHGRLSRSRVGTTEAAVRVLGPSLQMDQAQIHRALQLGERAEFERTALYARVFALAEQGRHRLLPRAVVPTITLASPKISRRLTTQWFATRVDRRYRRCLARSAG